MAVVVAELVTSVHRSEAAEAGAEIAAAAADGAGGAAAATAVVAVLVFVAVVEQRRWMKRMSQVDCRDCYLWEEACQKYHNPEIATKIFV